jgi:hypothetical protein
MVGISASGTPNTIAVCNSPTTAQRLLKAGPLCDAVYNRCALSGNTMLAVPATIAAAGSVGAWTQHGTGAGVVSSTVAPFEQILVKCMLSGAVGTASFQFSIDGGAYGATVVSVGSSWAYRVPGTLCTLTFAAGTYRGGDVYTIPTTGVITRTSGAPDVVTQVSSPVDAYELQVDIVLAGTRGTAQFTYSLDGGNSNSQPIVTAATVVLPDTGIMLAFTSAQYDDGDSYTATAAPATFDASGAEAAIAAALANPIPFEGIDLVQMPSSASAADTMALALDLELQAAETENKQFVFGLCACPSVEADATVTSALSTYSSATGRASVIVGTEDVMSLMTGLLLRRPASWSYGTRVASVRASESPGWVGRGGLPGVSAIQKAYGGAPTADTFDAARFATLRQFNGLLIPTNGNTMAPAGSDYAEIMNVRVVDVAATIAQAQLNFYVNADWRIDPDTGKIDARDANKVNAKITQVLVDAMVGEPGTAKDLASSVNFAIDTSSDLLSDATLLCTITIIPKGYSKKIIATIGFRNPRLTA